MTHAQAKNLLRAQVQRLTPKSIKLLKPEKFNIKFVRMVLANGANDAVAREVLLEVFKRALSGDVASKRLVRETLAKSKNDEVKGSLLSGFFRIAEKGDKRALPYLLYSAINEKAGTNKNLAIGGIVELFIKKTLKRFPTVLTADKQTRVHIIWVLKRVMESMSGQDLQYILDEIKRLT
jgi:hypothetical protein